jgi:uncharacterized protein YbaR (Trm112 family)
MSFDHKLLDAILVCTKCRSHLVRCSNTLVCTSPECRLTYAIVHEIPNMLLEEARPATPEDWSQSMQQAGRQVAGGLSS